MTNNIRQGLFQIAFKFQMRVTRQSPTSRSQVITPPFLPCSKYRPNSIIDHESIIETQIRLQRAVLMHYQGFRILPMSTLQLQTSSQLFPLTKPFVNSNVSYVENCTKVQSSPISYERQSRNNLFDCQYAWLRPSVV